MAVVGVQEVACMVAEEVLHGVNERVVRTESGLTGGRRRPLETSKEDFAKRLSAVSGKGCSRRCGQAWTVSATRACVVASTFWAGWAGMTALKRKARVYA